MTYDPGDWDHPPHGELGCILVGLVLLSAVAVILALLLA